MEVSGQLHTLVALPPGKEPLVPIGYGAGWAPEPVWTTWRWKNSWTYQDWNSDPSAFQPVASSYIDCFSDDIKFLHAQKHEMLFRTSIIPVWKQKLYSYITSFKSEIFARKIVITLFMYCWWSINLKSTVCWDVTPCSLEDFLHLHG
jgi:hypothetical protein